MKEASYWIALAHLPRWGHLKINNLIIKFHHENKITIEDFFHQTDKVWRDEYLLDEKQISDLKKAKEELPSNAFLAESFLSQGFEIIPITSAEYSKTLKTNLKIAHSPAVVYVKGNKKILNEKSIAIVGSRDASEKALKFTDNIAKLASKEYKVVVSGFAKGVDKQALDSAIEYKGQSIIVLPQGIMTFGTGFKKYYTEIISGDVLVLSTFFPKAPWKAELAMARNPIIYGLADEIYVAESAEKGGTWSGVIDGLKKGRKIYVRNADASENNANSILIQKGAFPVDFSGREMARPYKAYDAEQTLLVQEVDESPSIDKKILSALETKPLSAKELIGILGTQWTSRRLTTYMKKLNFVEIVKVKRTNVYKIKSSQDIIQQSLFS